MGGSRTSYPSRPAVRAVDCTTSCGMWLPHALGMRLPSPHQGACTKGEGAGKAPCCSTAHRLARISLSAQANRNASLGARKCQRCRSIGPLMSLLCLGLPRGAGSLCSRIKPHMKSYMSTTTCNDIVVVNYKKNGIGKEANRQSSAAGKEIGAVGRLERKSGLGRQERGNWSWGDHVRHLVVGKVDALGLERVHARVREARQSGSPRR